MEDQENQKTWEAGTEMFLIFATTKKNIRLNDLSFQL